jgi:hypothetical protein
MGLNGMLRTQNLPENHGGLTEVGDSRSADTLQNHSVCMQKTIFGLIYRKSKRMKGTDDKHTVLSVPAVLVDGDGGFTCCPDVLTPREAALYLRLDLNGNWQQTLRYYREKKKLKGTKIGRRVVYTRKELNAFADRMTK